MLKVGDRIERNLGYRSETPEDLSGTDSIEVLLSSAVGGKPGSALVTIRGIALAVEVLVEDDIEVGTFELARRFYWQLRDQVLKGVEYDEDSSPSEQTNSYLDQIQQLSDGLKTFLESGAIDDFIDGMRPLQPVDLWNAGQIGFLAENHEVLEAKYVADVAAMNAHLASIQLAA